MGRTIIPTSIKQLDKSYARKSDAKETEHRQKYNPEGNPKPLEINKNQGPNINYF